MPALCSSLPTVKLNLVKFNLVFTTSIFFCHVLSIFFKGSQHILFKDNIVPTFFLIGQLLLGENQAFVCLPFCASMYTR